MLATAKNRTRRNVSENSREGDRYAVAVAVKSGGIAGRVDDYLCRFEQDRRIASVELTQILVSE